MHELIKADYQGADMTFRDDGWFNATLAASKFGKRPGDWLKQAETKEYMAVLAEAISNCDPQSLLETKRGRRDSGTWLHPKLAVQFAVWCDMQIDRILRGDAGPAEPQELSTMRDRLPLHFAAAEIVQRHHVSFPVAHMANNAAAGSKSYRTMTKEQVLTAVPVAKRIASGAATPQDFALLDSGRRLLAGEQAQIEIDLDDPPYKPE